MQSLQPGQIVKIRNRQWRIDSIYQNEILATTVDSYNNIEKCFYLPFEKIEYAEKNTPDISIVGSLNKQLLYINAYRMSLIHGTSPLLSMQRSNVIPTNFQLVPVIMALNSPRVRLLIADDVGLGKTIEAGLVLNELIARNLIRKILIICPANLREQWQEAMLTLFKLNFKIISTLHRKYLEKELPVGASPWEYFNRLITSIDYAKAKIHRNELLDHNWDMIVIDEAHSAARPHTSALNEKSTMLRWQLLERISLKTKHLMLLTATPHNGYTDSFASLIETLDVNAVDTVDKTKINRVIAVNHVCQRTRKQVQEWLKQEKENYNPFPDNIDKQEVRIKALSQNEERVFQNLNRYSNHMSERAAINTSQRYLLTFTLLHLIKRALSSPNSLRISLQNRINKLQSNNDESEIKENEAKVTVTEADNLENFTPEEAGHRLERTIFDKELIEYEINELQRIYDIAKKIRPTNDSKYKKLIKETLPELFNYFPKIIIFTRYKDTLDYLCNNLKNDLNGTLILNIHGQLNNKKRKEIFAQFGKVKEQRSILVATDCISEGINLQYLCSQVIHYELPWNPNRMEQRNGRVDRFGQPEDTVHLRTMIVDNSLDDMIMKSIIEKADHMKADYGFSPPFFSDESQIINHLIRAGKMPRTRKGLFEDPNQLTIFDQLPAPGAVASEYDEHIKNKMDQIKGESFYGQSNITLPDIERKLRETEKSVGSQEEIETFIKSGLNLLNCKWEQLENDVYKIDITDHRLNIPGVDNCIPRATFNKTFAAKHQDTVLIDLSHPLVSKLIQIVKQKSANDESFYGRTAYKGSDKITNTITVLKVLIRNVVETTPSSIVEEIITLGFDLYGKKIIDPLKMTEFEKSEPVFCKRTDDEVIEDLQEAFADNFWESHLTEIIEKRRQELIAERKRLIEGLHYSGELPEGLKGITDIKFAQYDILTVTVGYPV